MRAEDIELRLRRWRSNLLARGLGRAEVVDVVRRLGGIQAQDPRAAGLAVRARSTGVTPAQVERARVDERAVVRSWFMRGTLHLVATEHAAWMLQVLGPAAIAATRRRCRELGLDDDALARGAASIGKAGEPLTRADVARRLRMRDKQAVYHVLRHGGLLGRLCCGPGEETWIATAEWLGAPLRPTCSDDEALRRLAETYLSAYGPAGVEDFASWSGLGAAQARRALSSVTRRAERAAPKATGRVRLLPAFDPYLLGYRSRSFAVAESYAKRVHPGGGMLRPVVVVDGEVVGTWRWDGDVEVDPFSSVPAAVEREAADVRRWLGHWSRMPP